MEATLAGSVSAGDGCGDVSAVHWSTPYRTLGYPRTHVLACGAMQLASVHGGALESFPS